MLSREKIFDKLNVSRTPVREAVLQLRFENLVDVFSGRGFGIRSVHFFDVQQIIQARTAIEGAGLRALIIGLDTPEGQETLRQMERCACRPHAYDGIYHAREIRGHGLRYCAKRARSPPPRLSSLF